jgi:hypothetical protein
MTPTTSGLYFSPASSFDKGRTATLHWAFFLLFPGFFFYQTLLGLGIIRAFLGGYFSVVSIVFLLPLLFFFLVDIKKGKGNFTQIDFYFFTLLIYCTLIIFLNFVSGANVDIVRTQLLSIIHLSNIFIMFRMTEFTGTKFKAIAIACLVLMSAIIFYFSIDGSFYLAELNESLNPESLSTYQGFARSYLLTFVIVISLLNSVTTRVLIYLIAVPSLFMNMARTEFIAILVLIPLIETYYSRHKLKILAAILIAVIFAAANYEYFSKHFPDNRVLELADLSHAPSANMRHHLTDQALRTIHDHPILGDYASYASGEYAHNILSAWVDFGVLGFIYAIVLLIYPMLRLYVDGFFSKHKSRDFLLACILMSLAVLWMLTSKTFLDMSIGAGLGAYANYKYRKTNVANCPPYVSASEA